MPKRRLFSRNDGTTFGEDVREISEEIAAFLRGIPAKIKSLLPEAEDIVVALEQLEANLRDGMPVDEAIDRALAIIPGTQQEAFYALAKQALSAFVVKLRIVLDKAGEIVEGVEGVSPEGAIKRATAVRLIREFNNMKPTENEAALALETAVFYTRNA